MEGRGGGGARGGGEKRRATVCSSEEWAIRVKGALRAGGHPSVQLDVTCYVVMRNPRAAKIELMC